MAKQTTVTVVDDMDGTPGASNVEFGLDGKSYEMDLSEANSERLRKLLAPFVKAARKVGSGPKRHLSSVPASRTARSTSDKEENRAIREWARGQGMELADRGRIPGSIVEAYAERDKVGAPADSPAADVAPSGAHCTRVAKLSGAQVRALADKGLSREAGSDWAVLDGDIEAAVAAVRGALDGMNPASPKGKAVGAVLKKLQTGDESLVTVMPVAQSA